MPSSSKKAKKGKFWQKAILFCGGGAFLMTAMLPIIGSWLGNNQGNNGNNAQHGAQSQIPTEELRELEANLLLVLDREPNNPNALQNLVRVRLELGDLPGAIDPLDKLITLFPEDEVLVDLKEQLEQNIVRSNPSAIPTEEGASPTPDTETSVTEETEEALTDTDAEADPESIPGDE